MHPDPQAHPPTAEQLSRLLAVRPESPHLWNEAELADVLRHQLDAPLLFDLGRLGRAGAVDELAREIGSFRGLLLHGAPPLDLLVLAKEYGKSAVAQPDSPVPAEVGTLLYYATIAAALLRLGRRITRMGDADLLGGLDWALRQPWVDADARALIGDAAARIRGGA